MDNDSSMLVEFAKIMKDTRESHNVRIDPDVVDQAKLLRSKFQTAMMRND